MAAQFVVGVHITHCEQSVHLLLGDGVGFGDFIQNCVDDDFDLTSAEEP